jgi:hypothetical protein
MEFVQILKEDYSDSNEMQTPLKRWENIIRVVSDGAFYIQIILAYNDTSILSHLGLIGHRSTGYLFTGVMRLLKWPWTLSFAVDRLKGIISSAGLQ